MMTIFWFLPGDQEDLPAGRTGNDLDADRIVLAV